MKNAKKMTKKVFAVLIAILMVASMLPIAAFASELADTTEYVYLSISFDGQYIDDKDGTPIIYMPIPLDSIAAVDLTEYGLDDMLYDADDDGEYETTALQLLIYAHEELYGGDWSDVTFDALPGSSYFKGGIFGFTENLMYFHNGDFPVDKSQTNDWYTVGATSDRIVLEAGDFLDVASFECFSFLWDQLGGFHFFADAEENFSHNFTAEAGETLSIKLMHSFCNLMYGESYLYGATDYELYYGKTYGEPEGTLTTDGDGNVDVTIDEAGTYYLWCYGANGSDDGTHGSCDHYNETGEPCIVSAPGFAKLTVTGGSEPEAPAPEQPRQPQDVSDVLDATMAQLATTVSAPSFGTNAGEWTVFSLARGGYFAKDNVYFTDYYNRIVATVNETAANVNLNGALDKNKSTENSRLIVALSAIGKDARAVGEWDLVEAYSANGINWIKKQGMNGTIWTLIALDSGNYETSDPTIRQQCVDSILDGRHDDGGWSLVTAKAHPSNVDITCMTLTALYPYRDQPAVAEACAEAIEWLSSAQLSTGGFPYGNGETSESCAWAIVALCTWGINPDTDSRFIKDGKSAIDNLLTYYVEADKMFAHQGTVSNAMATDQATYALVAYDRFINDKNALYDYSDVVFEELTPPVTSDFSATLGLPENVENVPGTTFNGVVKVNGWNNEASYKLLDLIVKVPAGLSVTDVVAGNRFVGGAVQYNLDNEGNLRIVYFDANNNTDLSVNGNLASDIILFTITFCVDNVNVNDELTVKLEKMSIKSTSDSTDVNSQDIVNTENAEKTVAVVQGITFSAGVLYQGDGVDLIPADKKAVLVTVTALQGKKKLTYNDGTNTIEFKYNAEIAQKMGIAAYVALVNSDISIEGFENAENFTIAEADADSITFGDINGDGVINAQDALAAVNMWLRKGDAPTDNNILSANVNGDNRIDTYDALGIVEAFVNDNREYAIVTKSTTVLD